ncbi:MAG: TonB-dependent receptor [Candidatus Omnitrophica bacterium]|nr:TonB-dependent receptor [Candidatus Omnitrophota bacterium]
MFENEAFSKAPRFSAVSFSKFILKLLFLLPVLIPCFIAYSSHYGYAAIDTANQGQILQNESGSTEAPAVTVVGSRLPSFKIPFSDVPANISYIPANVSRKNQEEIYETEPHTFQESIKDIEGAVFYDEVGNGLDTTFSLRGFNVSSAVIVLVDGVRINELDGDVVSFPLIDMTDIEAIQIDRGSASPIFGSNAFAGVVHLTTGRPSPKKMSLFGGFEYSSFGGYQFYQGISGTLKDPWTDFGGKLTYYFKGGRNLGDGFRSNGEYRLTNFNTKVAYELPDDQGRIYFGWKHTEGDVSNPGALTFDEYQANPDQIHNPLDSRRRDNTILQLGGDKKFFDDHLMLSLLTSQRYNDIRFKTTYATFSAFGEPSPDTDLVTQKSRATDLVWQAAYQDDWWNVHNLTTVGMEMRNADESTLNQDAFQGEVSNSTPNAERMAKPRSAGLFWREALDYQNVVIVHLGMRHDWHSVRINDQMTPANNISDRWHSSTVSTGLTLKPAKYADLFFNYSQGFRVPTLSEMISPSAFGTSVATDLAPVKSDSYELGSRLRYKDKAHFKASFFVIDLKDEIIFDSNSVTNLAPFGQNVNAGKSRRMGLETRFDAQPIEELKVYGSYTWTKAYIRETNGAQPFTGLPSVTDGRSLGLVPEHRMTFGFVAKPLKRFGEPFAGFDIGLHGIYTGKQHPGNYESASEATLNATGGAGYTIKSYTVWDLVMSYQWKGQSIYFKINNLFDNKYYSRSVNATSFGSGIVPAGTFNFVTPSAPREYIFGARWEI